MKNKIIIAAVGLITAVQSFAGDGGDNDPVGTVPEPSTIGLFVAAAIAVTVLSKLKK